MLSEIKSLIARQPVTLAQDFIGMFALAAMLIGTLYLPGTF
ncbi:MAG: hypothetical protein WDA25_08425 [Paracoccaceae bacterium]